MGLIATIIAVSTLWTTAMRMMMFVMMFMVLFLMMFVMMIMIMIFSWPPSLTSRLSRVASP